MHDSHSNSIFDSDEDFEKIASEFQKTPPTTLFHYTDAAGAQGIIESGDLWATHFESTNDSEEVSYGINLAIKVLKEELSNREIESKSVPPLSEICENPNNENRASDLLLCVALETLRKFGFDKSRYEFYFVCFSEKRDLLSQWRAYSGDGSGYSVGFFSKDLKGHAAKSVFPHGDTIDLLRVLYKPKEQRAQIRNIIERTAERFDKAAEIVRADERNDFIIKFNAYIVKVVLQSALFFKHPGFKEEKEWRLVCSVTRGSNALKPESETPVQTRVGRNGKIMPYIEIPFGCDAGGIRLHSFIVGPRNSPSARKERRNYGLTHLLRKLNGGSPVHGVKASKIPYR